MKKQAYREKLQRIRIQRDDLLEVCQTLLNLMDHPLLDDNEYWIKGIEKAKQIITNATEYK